MYKELFFLPSHLASNSVAEVSPEKIKQFTLLCWVPNGSPRAGHSPYSLDLAQLIVTTFQKPNPP